MLDNETINRIGSARVKYGKLDFNLRIGGEFVVATLSARDFTFSLADVMSVSNPEYTVDTLYNELLDVLETTSPVKPVVAISKPENVASEVRCQNCNNFITGYQSGTVYIPAERVMEISQERFSTNLCSSCYMDAANTRKRKV